MDIIYAGTLPPHQGGTAIMAYQLLDALSRLGHTVRAIAPRVASDGGEDALAGRLSADIAVHRFDMPYLETDPYAGAAQEYRDRQTDQLLARLGALCAQRRPDAILVGRSSFIWGVPTFARALGIPVVLWLHEPAWEAKRRDDTMHDGALLPEMRRADRVVACAKHLKAGFLKTGFGAVDAVVNGVDTSLFQPTARDDALRATLAIARTDQVAIHLSNLKPIKRPLDVVRCAAMLRERCPNLVWLIVGDGDGDRREAMTALARDLGVLDRFRFAGWVDHRQVGRYLNLADLAVLPSRSEAMAQAYLESMACGIPMVASDIPAAREAMRDGVSGMLHRVGDTVDMAEAVAALLADGARRARIGATARRRAETHYRFQFCASRFSDILTSVAHVHDAREPGRIRIDRNHLVLH